MAGAEEGDAGLAAGFPFASLTACGSGRGLGVTDFAAACAFGAVEVPAALGGVQAALPGLALQSVAAWADATATDKRSPAVR